MVLCELRDEQLSHEHYLLALRRNRSRHMNIHVWAAVVISCASFGLALAALGLTLAVIIR